MSKEEAVLSVDKEEILGYTVEVKKIVRSVQKVQGAYCIVKQRVITEEDLEEAAKKIRSQYSHERREGEERLNAVLVNQYGYPPIREEITTSEKTIYSQELSKHLDIEAVVVILNQTKMLNAGAPPANFHRA